MKTVYIFQNKNEQIFICIGLLDSPEVIVLISCVKCGVFFILNKETHTQVQTMSNSMDISEIKIPVLILKNLMKIIQDMKNRGINYLYELDEEVKNLEGWFHISELAISSGEVERSFICK